MTTPLDLYCNGVRRTISRMNTCPSYHLLARETPCKLLLHTRRGHTWQPPSGAILRLSFSNPPHSHQHWFRFSFLLLWKSFELSKQVLFNIVPSYQSQEKKMALATSLGIGITPLYPHLYSKDKTLVSFSPEARQLDNHPTSCLHLPVRCPLQGEKLSQIMKINTSNSSSEPRLPSHSFLFWVECMVV